MSRPIISEHSELSVLHLSKTNRTFGATFHHLVPQPSPLTPESTIHLPQQKNLNKADGFHTRYDINYDYIFILFSNVYLVVVLAVAC